MFPEKSQAVTFSPPLRTMPTTITAFRKLHSHSQYDRSGHLETC